MTTVSTTPIKTTVGSPNYEYESMTRLWKRARAVLNGELFAKEHDRILDNVNYTNLLVPFSPRMSPEQYRWYTAEAELPGLVSQYAKILTGGLLRKQPHMALPDSIEDSAKDWLRNRFSEDGRSLFAFLDAAIWEEISTSRAWVSIDFPVVDNYANLTAEEKKSIYPYPVLWKAEDIINWQTVKSPITGRLQLSRAVFRYIAKIFTDNPYHPTLVVVAADHYLDDAGEYCVDIYHKEGQSSVELINGSMTLTSAFGSEVFQGSKWNKIGDTNKPMISGKPFTYLPIFPMSGEISAENPILTPVIDREIALYNKVSRRNHLMYGASTFTPVVFSDMSDEQFEMVVGAGLGSWIKLNRDDKIDAFKTPTDALADMEVSIEASLNDLVRMGLKLLTPDGGGANSDSGVALEIRNSSVTAQLNVLNNKISSSMKEIIKVMLQWKYGDDKDMDGLEFNLSSDFNPAPLGSEWAKLATDWYTQRLIPRSVWLSIAKQHDIIPNDYDDDEGQVEINQDTLVPQIEQVQLDRNGKEVSNAKPKS